MTSQRRDFGVAAGLALVAFGIYACFLSKAYVFEGLIRAMPIETGRWVHLFAGNYLLYGPLGLTFHAVLHMLGIQPMAVSSLQVMDALLGAAGLFIFYRLLRRLGGDVLASVSWTGVLGFSLGYWLWSTEAENYILSTLLLMTNFYFLVRLARGERIDPVGLGALQGLAILGHIVNTLFAAVGLWFLIGVHGRNWKKPAGEYAAAALAVSLSAYGFVVAFIQKPDSAQAAWTWFKGSAGAAGDSINLGGAFSAYKFWEWLKMSAHIFVSFQPAYTNPPPCAASGIFLAAAGALLSLFLLTGLLKFKDLTREERTVTGGCFIWLVLYACVFMRWQPWTMVYRVSDLVPLCTLLFLTHRATGVRHAAWRIAPAALAVSLALGNGGAEILPRSHASNNSQLARMAFIRENTQAGDWIAGDSGQGEIYIPYFAQRRPLVIERFGADPDRLKVGIDALLAKGESVFVPSTVLENERWKAFFSPYRPQPKAQEADGFTLYQLRRYHR